MTEHFKDKELECRCCGKQHMRIGFMSLLEGLRMAYNKPMVVSSAYRCQNHNLKVSPKTGRHGPHTTGCAIDIIISGHRAYELLCLALQFGFTGIGIQQKGNSRFIHLDNLMLDYPRPRIWSY